MCSVIVYSVWDLLEVSAVTVVYSIVNVKMALAFCVPVSSSLFKWLLCIFQIQLLMWLIGQ